MVAVVKANEVMFQEGLKGISEVICESHGHIQWWIRLLTASQALGLG